MLICDLCSRLDVTSTHQSPDPRAVARATPIAASPVAPSRVRLHALKAQSSSSTPGCCCQPRQPQVAPRLCVAATSFGTFYPPFSGAPARNGARADPRLLSSAAHEPGRRTDDALCRASERDSPKRAGSEEPRVPPLAMRQHRAVMSPERLSSKDPPDATEQARRSSDGRHDYPGLATEAPLPTRISRARGAH